MKSQPSIFALLPIIISIGLLAIVILNIGYLLDCTHHYFNFLKNNNVITLIITTSVLFFLSVLIVTEEVYKKMAYITINPEYLIVRRFLFRSKKYNKQELLNVEFKKFQTRISLPNDYIKINTVDNKHYIISALYTSNFSEISRRMKMFK